jgi:hypothetical protein
MTSQKIRGFLLQLPKPALVRVTTGEGELEELKPTRSYQKLAASIEALDPQLIQCFDGDGKLLRAMRCDDADSRRSDAAVAPPALINDPETARLTHFANLLHRAYEHSTEIAFTKLAEIVDRMNERSESIEQRLERTEAVNRRLIKDQIDDAFDRAAEMAEAAKEQAEQGGGGFEQTMGQAFLSGIMSGKAGATTTNGKSNGATNGKAPAASKAGD